MICTILDWNLCSLNASFCTLFFSGKCGPETAFRMLLIAMMNRGLNVNNDSVHCFRSNDILKCCHKVLMSTHSAQHVFNGLLERVSVEHRDAIVSLRPLRESGRPHDLEMAVKAYKSLQKYIDCHRSTIWSEDNRADNCLLRPGVKCPLAFEPDPSQESKPLLFGIAGSMCTPYSSFGTRLRDAHPSTESYYVWESEIIHRKWDVVYLENNEYFPLHRFSRRMMTDGVSSSAVGLRAAEIGFSSEAYTSVGLLYAGVNYGVGGPSNLS